MTQQELIRRVSRAYDFHGSLGQERLDAPHCEVIRDTRNPTVWMSNVVFGVTAQTAGERSALFAAVEEVFDGYGYRHFSIDPLVPPSFSATLALQGYGEQTATLQQVLLGDLTRPVAEKEPAVSFQPVTSEADWATLHELVRLDHLEGQRTKGYPMDEAVTRGIVEAYRRKEGPSQFFLAIVDDTPCAYGSGITCPEEIGMVEDLFTLPDYRKRGIASAVIKQCVDYVRARGAGPVFIGAHVDDTPKLLYHRLGFEPLCLTRTFFKDVE